MKETIFTALNKPSATQNTSTVEKKKIAFSQHLTMFLQGCISNWRDELIAESEHLQTHSCDAERMFCIRDETGNRNESNRQEAGLVLKSFLGFIVCILFFFFVPLSGSKDKEERIPKISKRQRAELLPVDQSNGRFFLLGGGP